MNLAFMIFLGSSIGVGKDSGALTVFVFNLLVKCVGRIIPELGTGGAEEVLGIADVSSMEEARLEQLSLFSVVESTNRLEDCVRLLSMRIFLQISRSLFAMARAGTSHLKT